MAKPENSLYEIRAQLPNGSIKGTRIKGTRTATSSTARWFNCAWLEPGHGDIVTSHAKADEMVKNLTEGAHKTYEKGHKPRFYMRKTKLSDLVNRKDWNEILNDSFAKKRYEKSQINPLKVYCELLNSK